MSRPLVFHPNVEFELNEALDWYEAQRAGLGHEFLAEYEAALARIVENPLQYQVIEQDIRRAPVHRFPYGVMYAVSDEELLILTCFHGGRDPRDWQELRGE